MKKTPDRTSASAFLCYSHGEVVADSAGLKWPGLYVRRIRFPRRVERFLVPATPEPLITCGLAGSAHFQERDPGGAWISRQLERGHIFVTRSPTPYEVRWESPAGQELETLIIHVAVEPFQAALQTVYPDVADEVAVSDFFGHDESLANLCFACAGMLSSRVPGSSRRVESITQLLASWLAETYTGITSGEIAGRGGLPIAKLRKVEDYVDEHLAREVSVESMADLVQLSPFHFSRVFKQTTGMSPLQFVTRERIARAQQLIRETSRSLIEIALDVGYTSPSHFAQVFRREVGIRPTDYRRRA